MATRTASYDDLRSMMSEAEVHELMSWGHDTVALVEEGRTQAIAGVARHPELGCLAFAQWRPGRKPGGRGIMRLAQALRVPLRRAPKPVFATTETGAAGEAALLARLGFTYQDQGVWACLN